MDNTILGIDVGGTSIKYGLVDENNMLDNTNSISSPSTKDEMIELLCSIIKESGASIVGISMPGFVKDGFLITAGAHFDMYGLDLKKVLEEKTKCEIHVINDVNAIAMAQLATNDYNNYIVVAPGTGVGGSIVINKQIYEGKNGAAGEFGFFVITEEISDENSFSNTASTISGLEKAYYKLTGTKLNGKEIVEAAINGEENASTIFSKFTTDFAHHLYNLVFCFDPEVIFIGGSISHNNHFLEAITTKLDQNINAHANSAIEAPKLLMCNGGGNAGIIGAVVNSRK